MLHRCRNLLDIGGWWLRATASGGDDGHVPLQNAHLGPRGDLSGCYNLGLIKYRHWLTSVVNGGGGIA